MNLIISLNLVNIEDFVWTIGPAFSFGDTLTKERL